MCKMGYARPWPHLTLLPLTPFLPMAFRRSVPAKSHFFHDVILTCSKPSQFLSPLNSDCTDSVFQS